MQNNMEMENKIKRFMEEKERRESIFCPYCSTKQQNDDGQYPVTYWGDDGDEEYRCDECDKIFLVIELVTREYETIIMDNNKDIL